MKDVLPPYKITIETTSACNLRCVMCPHAIGAVHRPKHLPIEIADKLLPVIESGKYFELHGIGEPLLSPAFWRILEILANKNPSAEAVVNSNLVVLTDEMLAKIVASTLTQISVSLDAATAPTYYKIRGADFGRVLDNIGRLREALIKQNASRKLKLVVNMTMMKENLEEVVDFVRLAKSLGASEAAVWPLNDYGPADELTGHWTTNLRNWTFDYRQQMLTNIPQKVNNIISEAKERAKEINLPFKAMNLTEATKVSSL